MTIEKTNFQWIKDMSVDELVEFLFTLDSCSCCSEGDDPDCDGDRNSCRRGHLEWLMSNKKSEPDTGDKLCSDIRKTSEAYRPICMYWSGNDRDKECRECPAQKQCGMSEERTCKNDSLKIDQFICSRCAKHYDIADMDDDDWGGVPNYCPSCGAKVVNGR